MHPKEDIKDQIIEVARKIFSQFGFKKTTLEEIAQAAGKGKSSIYYYFDSKEDIFRAVVEKEAQILRNEIEKKLNAVKSPKNQLRTYILTRMESFKNLANFYNAVKNEYLARLDFIEKIRKKYDQDEVKAIERILQSGIDNGDFIIKKPEVTAIAIATAMKGLEIPVFFDDENYKLEKRLDEILDVLFFGLVKR